MQPQFGKQYIYDYTVYSLKNDDGVGDDILTGYWVMKMNQWLKHNNKTDMLIINTDLMDKLHKGDKVHKGKTDEIKPDKIAKIKAGTAKKIFIINSHFNKEWEHTLLFLVDIDKKEIKIYDSYNTLHKLYVDDLNELKTWLKDKVGISGLKEKWVKCPEQHNTNSCVYYTLCFIDAMIHGQKVNVVNKEYVTKFKENLLQSLLKAVKYVVLTEEEALQLYKDKPANIKEWYIKMRKNKGEKTYEEISREENLKKIIALSQAAPIKQVVARNNILQQIVNTFTQKNP